ncbi:hypothetical protein M3147_06315 [Agromyces mediolanus]|uniref:hypothetical protein n=1 Tax=Agromyces mediolanus TaxID=41986 RepID=UPI002041A87F|nr:hypothetical protein [Agromyces mediolanus]MCM3656865.1 hypothetical protein [Agromyces mediolanus]
MTEPGYLLVSASYFVETAERARELGLDGRAHHLIDLERIPGGDWRERQRRLDHVLGDAARAAAALEIPGGRDGVELVLRISFISDAHEQLAYALTSEFLGEWAALGGVIHIDH